MNSLTAFTISQMRRGLLQGDFSAVELTEAHLQRIKSSNELYNSFITISEEGALESAARADQEISEKKDSSPLFTGIPVAVKDMLLTKGVETTCASKILKGFIPPYDCTAVAKLRKAGAVMIGKTNQDEFGMGSSSEQSAFGPVKNPWDIDRVAGGSSGGSAVAVAAGQAPVALGTDTGGSIRQPASLSGVLGLRPTYGRVSRYGVIAYASSLDQVGGFARNTEDLANLLSVIAGNDAHDSTSMDEEIPDYAAELQKSQGKGLAGIRIGVPKEYFVEGLEEDVDNSIREGLETLSSLGAEIVEISLPHTEYALATYYIISPAEASSNLARYDGVRYGYRSTDGSSLSDMYELTRAQGFGEQVKRRIMIGSYVLSAGYYDAYYLKAQQVRTLIINDFKQAFANHCDLIVTPVSPSTAFRLGEKIDSPLTMYLADVFTVPVNLAGLPGLSVPSGLDRNGLPIGMQLIGPPFAEAKLLCTAQEFMDQSSFDTGKFTQAS